MIRATRLFKNFDAFMAVKDVSLHVQAGELMALLGPNGAGKTTTIRMLGSIIKPTSGNAMINGHDVVQQADLVRRSIGMLTEQPGLYLRMSGMEYLIFYGRLYGMSDSDIEKRGRELFNRFDMAGQSDRRLGEYSKGMRQKVGLIRAMLHHPGVLLLDEPTSAMDPHSAKIVRDSILAMRDERRAIILCTHNLAEAELLADRIAIIKQGEIVVEGETAVLKQQLLDQPQLEIRLNRPIPPDFNGLDGFVRDGVAAVESIHENCIQYRTANPQTINPQIVRHLDGLGYGTVALHEVSQSLEDVYLRVVGG